MKVKAMLRKIDSSGKEFGDTHPLVFEVEKTKCLCKGKGKTPGPVKRPGMSSQYYASEYVRYMNENKRRTENNKVVVSAVEV